MALVVVALMLGACAGPSADPPLETAGQGTPSSGTVQPSPSPTPSADPADWVREENLRPGSEDWRISNARMAADDELAGYASAVSARPGDSVDLMISSTVGDIVVTAYRLGHYGGAGAREVWQSPAVRGIRQPEPTVDGDRMVRAGWEPSLTVDTTDWAPGSYLFLLTANGRSTYVPLTVISPDVTDRLVIVSAVTTYAAYNTWGGYSLYYDTATRDFGRRAYA